MRYFAGLWCLLALVAAVCGRITYQDLSSPEDGIQGFAVTSTPDNWWQDSSTSGLYSDEAFVPAPLPSASRLNDIVDSLFDSVFPRLFLDGARGSIASRQAVDNPFSEASFVDARQPSVSQDGWEDVPQVVKSVSSDDLFRQLSLARFASPALCKFHVYVLPLTDGDADEPSMEELLSALTEEDFAAAAAEDDMMASMDDGTVGDWTVSSISDGAARSNLAVPSDDPAAFSGYDDSYDPVDMPTGYEAAGGFDYPSYDQEYATYYDGSYDGAYDGYGEYYGDVDLGNYVYDDVFVSGPGQAYGDDMQFADELDSAWRSKLEDGYMTEPFAGDPRPMYAVEPGFEQPGQSDGGAFIPQNDFNASWLCNWGTALLSVACAFVWVAVFVEFRRASAYARALDHEQRHLPDDPLAQPLMCEQRTPLAAEFDGVESADVFRAYSLKVQHAREQEGAPPAPGDALKAFHGP